jgi:hypothetical protein
MAPTISLNELYMTKREKERKRTVSFDKIVEMCHKRIRNIASFGGLNTFYEIPGMIVGFPLYNIFECCQYVITNLRQSGFLVQVLPPPHIAVLYISWDPNELNPQRKSLTPPPSEVHPFGLPAPTNKKNVSKTKRLKLFG